MGQDHPQPHRNTYNAPTPSSFCFLFSPWLETRQVLFMYEAFDDIVMSNAMEFKGKQLVSAESSEVPESKPDDNTSRIGRLSLDDEVALRHWMKGVLGSSKVADVTGSTRLRDHAAIVTQHGSATMRQYMRQLNKDAPLPAPVLEINAGHALIKKLQAVRKTDEALAKVVAEQLLDNALLTAGILDEPRSMVGRLNRLLMHAVGLPPENTNASDQSSASESGKKREETGGDAKKPKIIIPGSN
eukprot:m.176124 g.176124  ORF g.176124 m.176124 type:complete len:243 (-) comp21380_c0_seq1:152-880(-)